MALAKARIKVEHTGETIDVMFNPEEYTLNKDNNFASQAVPGLSGPLLQFVHGNMRTLEMELFFDTYLSHSTALKPPRDVREETQRIVKLTEIDRRLACAAGPASVVGFIAVSLCTGAGQPEIHHVSAGRPPGAGAADRHLQ